MRFGTQRLACAAMIVGVLASAGRGADQFERLRWKISNGERPKHVTFHWAGITDDDLAILTEMPWLESLGFSERVGSDRELPTSQLTDAWIDHLAGLTKLKKLSCPFLPITDDSLVRLQNRRESLVHLALYQTKVTDAGLAHLPAFTRLETVSLTRTSVTDAGMIHLTRLPRLTRVNLEETGVTDAGIGTLRQCKRMAWIKLAGPRITDGSLVYIQQMPNIHTLYLRSTKVTDQGVALLATLPDLQRLTVVSSLLTDRSLQRMKAFPVIDHLWVTSPEITDAGVLQLLEVKSLRTVLYGGAKTTDAVIEEYRKYINEHPRQYPRKSLPYYCKPDQEQ